MSRKKKNNSVKTLSAGKQLLIIMILSCSLVGFGVLSGYAVCDIYSLIFAVPAGILAFVMLLILLKNYKPNKKVKTTGWYADKYLAAFVAVWVIAALTVISLGYEKDDVTMLLGLLMFPVISIAVSPNAVMYALKDMKDWTKILYGNGNLENFKDSKDFYKVRTPVGFERRIFRTVVKHQILNISTVIVVMFILALRGIISVLSYDSYQVSPGDIFGALIYVRARRGTGVLFFVLLFIVVFGFPVFVYYVTNAIYKLRVVTSHKYIAYHAIVENVDSGVIRINRDGRHYKYKYCTLVGMRQKNVHDTPAVLIFLPDDLLMFPD